MNPPIKSKLNATGIAIAVATLVITNSGMSLENQTEALKLVGYIAAPLIVVLRTWFTDKKQ